MVHTLGHLHELFVRWWRIQSSSSGHWTNKELPQAPFAVKCLGLHHLSVTASAIPPHFFLLLKFHISEIFQSGLKLLNAWHFLSVSIVSQVLVALFPSKLHKNKQTQRFIFLAGLPQVLQSLQYIDSGGAVQLKGRVACQISSHELLLTELLFENVLSPLAPEESAALLSCLVFTQNTQVEPHITNTLQEVRRQRSFFFLMTHSHTNTHITWHCAHLMNNVPQEGRRGHFTWLTPVTPSLLNHSPSLLLKHEGALWQPELVMT